MPFMSPCVIPTIILFSLSCVRIILCSFATNIRFLHLWKNAGRQGKKKFEGFEGLKSLNWKAAYRGKKKFEGFEGLKSLNRKAAYRGKKKFEGFEGLKS